MDNINWIKLKDKELKISWRVLARDGVTKNMHVAGKYVNIENNTLTFQGDAGDVFSIPLKDLISIKIRRSNI